MKKFYSLVIGDIIRETEDAVSIILSIPENLKLEFKFKPGQYVTILQKEDGNEFRRAYSISSGVNENTFKITIKKIKGGKFSIFANEVLRIGDVLEVMPPMGNFTTKLSNENSLNYLFIATGSGITPIISLIKSILYTEDNGRIVLLYGNKKISDIIFREEIELLKNTFIDRFSIFNFLSQDETDSDLLSGRISFGKVKDLLAKISFYPDKVFLCGIETMVLDLKERFPEIGARKENILFELFGKASKEKSSYESLEDDNYHSEVSIIIDGDLFKVRMTSDDDNIVDAAEKAGIDVPYACKSGMCSTCKAKIINGKVKMSENYSIEEDELNDGYILTCQSKPITEKLIIDFDVL